MGRTAKLAMRAVVKNAQLSIIQTEKARQGKRTGTDQAMAMVIRGLNTFAADARIVHNLTRRGQLLERAEGDLEYQGAERAKCADSFLYWLEFYAWTYNPRVPFKQKTLPFVPYDFQREAAAWLAEVKNNSQEAIIEKARDMGATWLLVAWFTWHWLFEDEFTGLFCSRKVNMVDSKGDPSSVMHKARIIIRCLPSWMQPVGYEEPKHALKLRILNPQNGSLMIGEGGKELGRGGRASMVAIDEAAFLANPESAEPALAEVSEVKYWLSTPNMPGDWFCNKRHADPPLPVLSLAWMLHPEKNKWVAYDSEGAIIDSGSGVAPDPVTIGARRILYPWYEKAKSRYTDRAKLAREVDIDYTASSDRLVFPAEWVQAAIDIELGTFEVCECAADMAGTGDNHNVWGTRRGPRVTVIKNMDRPNATQTARAILTSTDAMGARCLHYDVGGGYGGAVAGEYDPKTNGGKVYSFLLDPINFGGKVSGKMFGGKPARELFQDKKAEIYWLLRERFRRTYELAMWRRGDPAGVPHRPEDCISIPRSQELISQLGTIVTIEAAHGRVQLESKKDMQARGVKSPDQADMLAMLFAVSTRLTAADPARTTVVNS